MTSSVVSGAVEKVTDVKVVQVSSAEDDAQVLAEIDDSTDYVTALKEEFRRQLASYRCFYALPKSLNLPLRLVWAGKAVGEDDNICAGAARAEKVVEGSSVEANARGLAELLPEEKFSDLILWKPRPRSTFEQTSDIRIQPEPLRPDAISNAGSHFSASMKEPPPRRATAADFGVTTQSKRQHARRRDGKSVKK